MPLNLARGLGWLLIAAIGYFLIDTAELVGMSAYTQRKLGALLTIAAVVLGSYRVSRDVFKIDPASCAEGDRVAYALLQLARVLLCGAFAIAANVSV